MYNAVTLYIRLKWSANCHFKRASAFASLDCVQVQNCLAQQTNAAYEAFK